MSPPPMAVKTSQGVVTNSHYVPHFWSLVKPVANGSSHPGIRFQSLLPANNSTTEKFPASISPHCLMENVLPSNKFSIYPLYYSSDTHQQGLHSGFEITPRPISTSLDSANGGVMEKTSASDTMAANGITQNEARYSLGSPCDLALRLGPLSASSSSYEHKIPHCMFKVGSGSSPEEAKSDDCSPVMERKLPLFPLVNPYSLSKHNPWERSLEGECVDAEPRIRKRKADFSHLSRERHLSWLSKLPSSGFTG